MCRFYSVDVNYVYTHIVMCARAWVGGVLLCPILLQSWRKFKNQPRNDIEDGGETVLFGTDLNASRSRDFYLAGEDVWSDIEAQCQSVRSCPQHPGAQPPPPFSTALVAVFLLRHSINSLYSRGSVVSNRLSHIYIYIYTYIRLFICLSMCIDIYIYTYIHAQTCMCVYIYTHSVT